MNSAISDILKKVYHEKQLARFLVDNFIRTQNLNSKKRKEITDSIYQAIKFIGFFKKNGFKFELEKLNNISTQQHEYNENYLHETFGFDIEIAKKIIESISKEEFLAYLKRAPLTIRANMLKTTREKLILEYSKKFKKFDVHQTEVSPYGVIFDNHINVRALEKFKKGFFEIQDEASQLITFLIPVKPGTHVLDICAGTGGKSLALSSHFFNSLKIDAFDIDKRRLHTLFKRMKITESKINVIQKPKKEFYDAVLIDAPCSGLGTWRRDVDLNVRTSAKNLDRKIKLQRQIFDNAINATKKGGYILYITCSFLMDENEKQVNYFLEKYKNIELLDIKKYTDTFLHPFIQNNFFKTSPLLFEMDHFFAALFIKK